MAVARYLIDKSAFGRLHLPAVTQALSGLFEHGSVAICGLSALELVYAARSTEEHAAIEVMIGGLFEWLPTEDRDYGRAREVSGGLAKLGHRRSVGIVDLVLAAVAERHGVTVLHYDADYDLIAEVTGQSCQWVVPKDSLP